MPETMSICGIFCSNFLPTGPSPTTTKEGRRGERVGLPKKIAFEDFVNNASPFDEDAYYFVGLYA